MKITSPLFLVLLGMACGLPANARAQPNPNGQIIVTSLADSYLVLIRDPVVQAELRLDDQQRQAIRELTDELDGPMWTLRNQGGEKANQQFKEVISTAESRMEQILTAVQRKRLNQMRVSVCGLQVLLRDDVAQKLDLSEQQRTQIRQVLEEAAKPKEESTPRATNGKIPSKPIKSKKSVNTPQTRIAAILSRQQLARLTDVLGPPVDASKLGYVKFKAPELDGKDGWLNSPPLTMSQLRGQVVALHFWTFGCINCIHNHAHYRGWQESFAKRGLTIIGIHTPESEEEHNVQTVQEKTKDAKFEFPVLVDNERRNWNAWGNSMWPTVYLIDKHGYVRYWWMGELNWEGAEGEKIFRRHIEELLAEQ